MAYEEDGLQNGRDKFGVSPICRNANRQQLFEGHKRQ